MCRQESCASRFFLSSPGCTLSIVLLNYLYVRKREVNLIAGFTTRDKCRWLPGWQKTYCLVYARYKTRCCGLSVSLRVYRKSDANSLPFVNRIRDQMETVRVIICTITRLSLPGWDQRQWTSGQLFLAFRSFSSSWSSAPFGSLLLLERDETSGKREDRAEPIAVKIET